MLPGGQTPGALLQAAGAPSFASSLRCAAALYPRSVGIKDILPTPAEVPQRAICIKRLGL